MRSFAFSILLVLVSAAWAGCIAGSTDDAVTAASVDETVAPSRARVVVADIDTGINPYHTEFRDDSPEAYAHPSTYLPGFPADAPALNLTFDADDYEAAVLADCETWQAVEPETLYWIPGTRIVGAITFFGMPQDGVPCEEDALPGMILDRGGHGTMTTSRVAGATYSLCPECKIVSIQGFESRAMLWAAEQPYIDLQTNSWGALPTDYVDGHPMAGQNRDDVKRAAAMQPIFVAGGNGLLGFFGVSGHPAYSDDIAGPEGILMVGGHDGGRFTPWTMTMPHVVADANMHPAAFHDSLDEGADDQGGGTSGATPFAAGTFARMLLELRLAVNDTSVGVREGNLVIGDSTAEGPLSDGALSLFEAKMTFYHTANPRPVRDGDRDGPSCEPGASLGCALYPTAPVEWGTIPAGLPMYYFVGYGQVGELTLQAHVDAALGTKPTPQRPMEDAFHGFDSTLRKEADR